MNTKTLLITSLRSISHHKGRSLLTMLGIIIGIASIIAIMAIGRGAEEKAKQQILAEGDNFIYVHPGSILAYEKGKVIKKQPQPFNENNIEFLKKQIPHLKKISPASFSSATIKARGNNLSVQLHLGNQDLLTIIGRTVANGSFFNANHTHKGSRVIVLGHQAAHELFKNNNPIGQSVQINKMNFIVIGVVEKFKTAARWGGNPDLDCFIPFKTGKKMGITMPGNKVPFIALSLTDLKHMPATVIQIRKLLRMQRRIPITEPEDFTIIDQASMLKAAQATSGIFSILLFIIAAIALLVGGIGVMNIMLVSVKERTQEIGIRMALGARGRLIAKQFLLEAVILCCLGGIIGIVLGCSAPFIIAQFTGWMVIITLTSILIAVAAIIAVGLIFGFYPAQKAAQLDPVLALSEQ